MTGYASTLGNEYSFSLNGILCGGVVALNLDLSLVCCDGDAGMVNAGVSTLGGGWVLF